MNSPQASESVITSEEEQTLLSDLLIIKPDEEMGANELVMEKPTVLKMANLKSSTSFQAPNNAYLTKIEPLGIPEAPPTSIQYSPCRTIAVTCTTFFVNIFAIDHNRWVLKNSFDISPYQDFRDIIKEEDQQDYKLRPRLHNPVVKISPYPMMKEGKESKLVEFYPIVFAVKAQLFVFGRTPQLEAKGEQLWDIIASKELTKPHWFSDITWRANSPETPKLVALVKYNTDFSYL